MFDLPGLRDLLARIERREVRIVSVETRRASPFASSLLFDYIAAYMYEGDAPLLDRRAQALALDRDLLRELLGAEELRELLDADALAELELELPALTPERAAGSADAVHDLLRRMGDLASEEADRVRGADARGRVGGPESGWRRSPRTAARFDADRGGGRWIAAEDAGRYRDASGSCRRAACRTRSWRRRAMPSAGCSRATRRHGPFLTDGRDTLGAAARRRGERAGAADGGGGPAARRVPARRRGARVV